MPRRAHTASANSHSNRRDAAHEDAERALRESEERFRRLAEASFEGIVINDQGRHLETNAAFAAMLGYSRQIPGMGIGLYVVKVVELHGGTVAVESEEGRGSTFTIRLPLAVP